MGGRVCCRDHRGWPLRPRNQGLGCGARAQPAPQRAQGRVLTAGQTHTHRHPGHLLPAPRPERKSPSLALPISWLGQHQMKGSPGHVGPRQRPGETQLRPGSETREQPEINYSHCSKLLLRSLRVSMGCHVQKRQLSGVWPTGPYPVQAAGGSPRPCTGVLVTAEGRLHRSHGEGKLAGPPGTVRRSPGPCCSPGPQCRC